MKSDDLTCKPVKKRNLIKEFIIVALVGFPMAFLFCRSCLSFSNIELLLKLGIYSSTIWIVMWFGNYYISELIDSKVSWLKNPVKRLVLGIIAYIVYPIVGMYIVTWIFYYLWNFNSDVTTLAGTLKYGIPAVIITFLIASFLSARQFFIAWRQLAVNEEKIKKEAISSKYESLKNQVSPHFLFNSLNVLTTLVYEDQDLAAEFIKKLANVYRYVLDMKDKEVVKLETEIEFLESYAFLQKIRHTEGLEFEIDLPESHSIMVAPLAIQMLVENAIKHNAISKEKPLKIRIWMDKSGYIIVSNNLAKKQVRQGTPSHIGLENIRERFRFLSDKPVIVENTGKEFIVKIPALTMEPDYA